MKKAASQRLGEHYGISWLPEGGETYSLTPTPEQIDENGHMNNAAYFDAVEPLLPAPLRERRPFRISVEYEHEIPAGRRFELRVVAEGESCFFEGSMEGKPCFRLREDFIQSGDRIPV